MSTSRLEVAEIFRRYGEQYRHSHRLSREQRRVMAAIEQCRTAALGGHVYQCDQCGSQQIRYNSCRNRHCPKCQGLDRERWLGARAADLLPVEYYHVVFTVAEALNPLFLRNPRRLYNLLFQASQASLQQLAADSRHLGAQIGILAVLHTWGSNLTLHPHIHCIVPGGGLSGDGKRWVCCQRGFLLPVRALSRLFRGKFLRRLKELWQAGELVLEGTDLQDRARFQALLAQLYATDWVVYSKPPFGGPETVLKYLARYTHRIATSNQRLLRLEAGRVVFRWKDYAAAGRWRLMSLEAEELIRRFLLHVLPPRFVRIRYFGLLAHRKRRKALDRARAALNAAAPEPNAENTHRSWQEEVKDLLGVDVHCCPACGEGRLCEIRSLPATPTGLASRGPP